MWKMLPAVSLLLTSLTACNVKPVQIAGTPESLCTGGEFSYPLMINPDDGSGIKPSFIADPFDAAIDGAYSHKSAPEMLGMVAVEPIADSMLFLSGGSQNGAYGAGLLAAWAEKRSEYYGNSEAPQYDPKKLGLPRFRVITGISTGALQSTFAFIDRPEVPQESYRIEKERELLHSLVNGGKEGSALSVGRNLATQGSIARLDPLRLKVNALISDEVLRLVAAEAFQGSDLAKPQRRLLIGAIEMDSGNAVVFDLGKIAAAWVVATNAGNSSRAGALKACYVESLIASSSVPIAAQPVFIDGKMFIDGGARFGVLSERVGQALQRQIGEGKKDRSKNLFIVVNGTLKVSPKCSLKDIDPNAPPSSCVKPLDKDNVPVHEKWSFDKLALRSMSVLIDQSYRSSIYWASMEAQTKYGFTPRVTKVNADPKTGYLAHKAKVGAPFPDEEKTCLEWMKVDKEIDKPTEFHPRFMRCLVDFGRKQKDIDSWVKLD